MEVEGDGDVEVDRAGSHALMQWGRGVGPHVGGCDEGVKGLMLLVSGKSIEQPGADIITRCPFVT